MGTDPRPSRIARGQLPAMVRLIHPAPTLAVVALSAALASILAGQAGGVAPWRIVLTVLAVAGSQVATGSVNDWADRGRDAVARRVKPIPAGEVSPSGAIGVAAVGFTIQVASSVPLGVTALAIGLAALASAQLYNLGLSRTPLSVVPYVVSFGLLPAWIAAGIGLPLARVAAAMLLVAPFAAAAHLANTLRDWDADARQGSRSLAHVLGASASHRLALGLALLVGLGAGLTLTAAGQLRPASAALGALGLAGVLQGSRSATRLWYGILVAAVSWTAAWALATG
jgi:4-hydroxybenzoate polyprenyltransferase